MNPITSLELAFYLVKKDIRSKTDCLVLAFHCMLIDDGFQCVGTGTDWTDRAESASELLPPEWNSNQDEYNLRYISDGDEPPILLTCLKTDDVAEVTAMINENVFARMLVPIATYVSENYQKFSTAYTNLDSLSESFHINALNVLFANCLPRHEKSYFGETKDPSSQPQGSQAKSNEDIPQLLLPNTKPDPDPDSDRDPRSTCPKVGGQDLNPLAGSGSGGMIMDPSSFGVPGRPTLPQFGVGGPGGLPSGAVPPGARFDPINPPIRPQRTGRKKPHPDTAQPPDADDV